MKTRIILFSFLIGLALFSCKKEEESCSDIYHGSTTYTEKSLESIPYLDKSIVIFKDSLNQEIEFIVKDLGDKEASWEFPGNCETNFNDTILHRLDVKLRKIELNNDSIEFHFGIYIITLLDWDYFRKYDKLFVVHNIGDSIFLQNFEMVSDRRDVPEKQAEEINFAVNTLEPEIEIFGETFQDVYHLKFFDKYAPHKLYYNIEFGVISFKDNTGKRWVFERFY